MKEDRVLVSNRKLLETVEGLYRVWIQRYENKVI